jgi:hypothetical protein
MVGGERIGPRMRAALAFCLALAMAGCELAPPPPAPPPPQPAMPAAVTRLPSPPPRKPPPPQGPSLARLPPATEGEPAPAPTGSFDQLVGLDQPQVAALLGEPDASADAPPATIWRYGDTTCDVDIYFYLDLQSQTMRALHYEVRNHDLSERPDQRCYDALAGERRAHAEPAAGSDRPR